MSKTITLKRIEKDENNTGTVKGYWRPWKCNFEHKLNRREIYDPAYTNLCKEIQQVESLLEIGSDLGRSTAWLTEVARNIDVYENTQDYIGFCKIQFNNFTKHTNHISNVVWHTTDSNTALAVLKTVNKRYDCIVLATEYVTDCVETCKTLLNPGGLLCVHDTRRLYHNVDLSEMIDSDKDLVSQNGVKKTFTVIKYK